MSTITIEVPDELSDLLAEAGDRLPELLAQSLRQPPLPAYVYRYVLDFLASNPTAEEIASFAPTPEMSERLKTLLAREAANNITPTEKAELDDYERLEHLMVMIKAGMLRNMARAL
jgi:hypothetical protein